MAEENGGGGVSRRVETGRNQINVREIGESVSQPTRGNEVPIQYLQRANQTAMEIQPALANEGIGEVARRIGKLGEDLEEKLVGEEKGWVHGGGEIGG